MTGEHEAREQIEALGARVRRLPPPSWTGPAAEAFSTGVARVARLLDGAADAVGRVRAAARRFPAP